MLSKEQLNYLLKTKARYRWMLDSEEIGTVTIQNVFETIETQQKALEKAKEALNSVVWEYVNKYYTPKETTFYKINEALEEIEKLGVEE